MVKLRMDEIKLINIMAQVKVLITYLGGNNDNTQDEEDEDNTVVAAESDIIILLPLFYNS